MKKYFLMLGLVFVFWIIIFYSALNDTRESETFFDMQYKFSEGGLFAIKDIYPKLCSEEMQKLRSGMCKNGFGFDCYTQAWCLLKPWQLNHHGLVLKKEMSQKIFNLMEKSCNYNWYQACKFLGFYFEQEENNRNESFNYEKERCESYKPMEKLQSKVDFVNNFFALDGCFFLASRFYGKEKSAFFDNKKAIDTMKLFCENINENCRKTNNILHEIQRSSLCTNKLKGYGCFLVGKYLERDGLNNDAEKYYQKAKEMGYEPKN